MTKNEAVEKLRAAQPRIDTAGNATLWIDAFVALGMLELSDPPDGNQMLAEAMTRTFSFETTAKEMILFRAELDRIGLKIVEKDFG